MKLLLLLLLLFVQLLIAVPNPKKKAKARKAAKKGAQMGTVYLEFAVPELDFGKTSMTLPLGVRLLTPPEGPVSVYMEAPNFAFSSCKLDFTPDDWGKQQVVQITPLPYLTPTPKGRVVQAKFVYSGKHTPALHKQAQFYNLRRSGASGATCTASGDPHYKSFAKRLFDFQGQGAYYLVQSPDLTIQQVNQLWARSITVQVKVAIRYKKTVYVFDCSSRKHFLASDTTDGITITAAGGAHWRAILEDGSTIRINNNGNPKRCHMATTVVVGEQYRGKVKGLCGAFEHKNFVCADGRVVKHPKEFGATWSVPQEDNLFTLGEKAACVANYADDNAKGANNACKVPDLDKDTGEADGTNNLEKGEKVVKEAPKLDTKAQEKEIKAINAEPRVPAKAPSDKWAKEARLKCKTTLTIQDANNVLDPKIYIDDCTDDCVLSGSFDFIEDAKKTYLEAVRRFVNSAKAEPAAKGNNKAAKEIKEIVQKAADAIGMGKNGCPKDCNGNGQCLATGCACKEGFTGLDCSEKVPKAPPAKEAFTDKPLKKVLNEEVIPEPKLGAVVNKAVKEMPAAKGGEAKAAEGGEAKAAEGGEAKAAEGGEAKAAEGGEAKAAEGGEAKEAKGEAKEAKGEAKEAGGEAAA